jgi:hypothetical protein
VQPTASTQRLRLTHSLRGVIPKARAFTSEESRVDGCRNDPRQIHRSAGKAS